MHELAVAEGIVEQVADAMQGRRVTCVNIEIGKLSGVVPDSILFCFDLLTEGTILEGASLHIEETIGQGRCLTCDSLFPITDFALLCPCGSADVHVVNGNQLLIKSVEVV